MIENDAGQVAMVLFQPTPRLVGGAYFDVRHGVSLAWVDKAAVPSLLAEKGGCCGSQRQLVHPANENEVSVWSDGKYP